MGSDPPQEKPKSSLFVSQSLSNRFKKARKTRVNEESTDTQPLPHVAETPKRSLSSVFSLSGSRKKETPTKDTHEDVFTTPTASRTRKMSQLFNRGLGTPERKSRPDISSPSQVSTLIPTKQLPVGDKSLTKYTVDTIIQRLSWMDVTGYSYLAKEESVDAATGDNDEVCDKCEIEQVMRISLYAFLVQLRNIGTGDKLKCVLLDVKGTVDLKLGYIVGLNTSESWHQVKGDSESRNDIPVFIEWRLICR